MINLSAGPGEINKDILKKVSKSIIDYKDGISICELSHFSKEWKNLYSDTINKTNIFLNIPTIEYESFYINGGATHQFTSLCYNLCNPNSIIQVLETGYWSKMAISEFSKYCNVCVVKNEFDLLDSSDFVFTYFCKNETISGFQIKNNFSFQPKSHYLVSDMSSILGRCIKIYN